MYKLPNRWRPSGLRYRKLNPGLDLPCWFLDGIRAVDPNLYFVWHPYRVLYEGILMNQYSGEIENPRYTIGAYGNEEIWGYILTDGRGSPLPDEKWHCWRLCEQGWAHVFDLKSGELTYLKTLLDRLWLQARITEKYGAKAYSKLMEEERQKTHDKKVEEEEQLMKDVQKENQWLISSAIDEFGRKNVNPTNPERDVIMSGPWSKRSKITREITDEEGGLHLPEEWRRRE